MYGLRNWDDLRIFLAVARQQSFLRAANELSVDQSTVSRRIMSLESQLGAQLFDRTNQGARLTPTGQVIYRYVDDVEGSISLVERGAVGVDQEMRGPVTISATEGIGLYWLIPRMADLQRRNPGLELNIDLTNQVRDLREREADIAVRYGRPTELTYRARHVADIRLMPFASRSYLREHGEIRKLQDLRNHFIVEFKPIFEGENWQPWREAASQAKGIVFRSTSAEAVARAANFGYGVAMLPEYAAELHSNLVQIPLDIGPVLEIWVASHEISGKARRVRATLDFIYKLFEIDRYRYFSG